MKTTYNEYSDRREWESLGLKDFGDYADGVQYINQRECYGDSLEGEWFTYDADSLTVYGGTFGNDHSPGSSIYTWAEVYDDASEFDARVKSLEAFPEWTDVDDDE
jgi:hypothetical protein